MRLRVCVPSEERGACANECASGGERVSVRARGAGAIAARSLAGPGSAGFSACAWACRAPRSLNQAGLRRYRPAKPCGPAGLQEELTVSVSRTRARGSFTNRAGAGGGRGAGRGPGHCGPFPRGCARCSQPSGHNAERPRKAVTFASGLASLLVIFLSVCSLLCWSSAFWTGHRPTVPSHI